MKNKYTYDCDRCNKVVEAGTIEDLALPEWFREGDDPHNINCTTNAMFCEECQKYIIEHKVSDEERHQHLEASENRRLKVCAKKDILQEFTKELHGIDKFVRDSESQEPYVKLSDVKKILRELNDNIWKITPYT